MSVMATSVKVVKQDGTVAGDTVAVLDKDGLVVDADFPLMKGANHIHDMLTVEHSITLSGQHVFYIPNSGGWQLNSVREAHTASGGASCSVQMFACTSGQTVSGGVAQLSGTMTLSGVPGVVQSGNVIASPTTVTPGMFYGIEVAATLTPLVGSKLTAEFKRVR